MAVLISKSILMNIIFCSMITLCILVNLAHANWHTFLKLYGTSVKSFKTISSVNDILALWFINNQQTSRSDMSVLN